MTDVDHEDDILRTFILFTQTARLVLKSANAHLYRKARLSTVKLIVLRVLASNGGIMKPSKIAEWTQTERHNITALINRMKREGLITTKRNKSNERTVQVSLTDKGQEVLSQAMPVAKEVVDKVLWSITKDDAVVLEKSLRILKQNARHIL